MVEREQRGALNAMLKSMKLGEEALIKLTCGCVGWRRCASSVRRIASQAVLLALDNTGRITRDFNDALCVIATGGTIAGRRLYTNNEEVVVDISRPVIINGLVAIWLPAACQ